MLPAQQALLVLVLLVPLVQKEALVLKVLLDSQVLLVLKDQTVQLVQLVHGEPQVQLVLQDQQDRKVNKVQVV